MRLNNRLRAGDWQSCRLDDYTNHRITNVAEICGFRPPAGSGPNPPKGPSKVKDPQVLKYDYLGKDSQPIRLDICGKYYHTLFVVRG